MSFWLKGLRLGVLGFLCSILLFVGTETRAEEFVTVGVTAELRYSSLETRSKRMGKVRGTLRARKDLAYVRLELGGREYPIELAWLNVGSRSRRVSGRFEMSGESIRELFYASNRSILRKPSTREAVNELLERQDAAGAFAHSYQIRFKSLPQLDFEQPDLTIHQIEFLDDSKGDALVLSLDFSDRAKLD